LVLEAVVLEVLALGAVVVRGALVCPWSLGSSGPTTVKLRAIRLASELPTNVASENWHTERMRLSCGAAPLRACPSSNEAAASDQPTSTPSTSERGISGNIPANVPPPRYATT